MKKAVRKKYAAVCLLWALLLLAADPAAVGASSNGPTEVTGLTTEDRADSGYVSVAPTISDNSGSVYDLAGVLDEEESEKLEELIQKTEKKKNYRIVVVTTDDNPASPMAYADDFTDFNGFGPDCILFLLDLDNRQQWISTTGVCMEASGEKKSSFSQRDIENILDATTGAASDGDYYKCIRNFVVKVKNHANLLHTLVPTGLSLVISAVLSVLVLVGLLGQHKAKAPVNIANAQVKTRAFQIGVNRAVFMGTQTFTRRIPKNDGNSGSGRGGGGGMHVGGSGTSHGGGGRGF